MTHKKRILALLCGCLVFFLLLLPLAIGLCACFDYQVQPANGCIYGILTALLSVCTLIAARNVPCGKALGCLFCVLAPFSMICGFLCAVRYASITAVICALIGFGCCAYSTKKYGKPVVFKYICMVLCVLMLLPMGLLGIVKLTVGDLSHNTVVQTVESPDKTYYAEVICSDQGAMGGNTFVDVYESKRFDLLLLTIEKEPQRVYSGSLDAYKDMDISWKSDHCLVVDDVQYDLTDPK